MIRFTNNIDWLESKAREEANSVISVGGLIMHLRDAEKKAASQAVQAVFEEINIHSDVAIYVQIENQVQFAIASGNLKAEDKLPSVRELSHG